MKNRHFFWQKSRFITVSSTLVRQDDFFPSELRLVLQFFGRGFQQTAIAVSRPPLLVAYIGIEILVDLVFF